MISQHNIKIGLAILIIMYVAVQLIILQGERIRSKHITLRSDEKLTFFSSSKNDQGRMSSASFETSPNNSFSHDAYLNLTRVTDYENRDNPESSCSSNVRLLRGYRRGRKGYITIGISTVPRDEAYYLPEMLTSLISKITEKDKQEIVIVIFLGSQKRQWVNMTLDMIDVKFADSVRDGLIQVIQPDESIYPDFRTITKRNFNDTLERVYWRTKQNIDYAYLFAYCDQLSKYYMHLEDDIITANGFMFGIKTFVSKVEKSNKTWFLLEFSTLGFIGKLFRSSDLCTLKAFLLLFKDEKPCDELIGNLKEIKTQNKRLKSPKSLFQHFGLSSSLKGKIQNLTDKHYKGVGVGKREDYELLTNFKSNKFPNPEAKVYTSMNAYGLYSAEKPYSLNMAGFFWATNPNTSDFYNILFVNPVNITEVQIKTGHPTEKKDRLENAFVKVGNSSEEIKCKTDMTLGSFKEGQFTMVRQKPLLQITCLEILVVKAQSTWVIIYEIIIRTNETEKRTKPYQKL